MVKPSEIVIDATKAEMKPLAKLLVKGVRELQIMRMQNGLDVNGNKLKSRKSKTLKRKQYIISGQGSSKLLAMYKSSSSKYKAKKASDWLALTGGLTDSITTKLNKIIAPRGSTRGFIIINIESNQDAIIKGLDKNGMDFFGIKSANERDISVLTNS